MHKAQHSREKTPFTRLEKATLAAIAALVLLIAGILGYRYFRYHRETVLFGPKNTACIYILPDNSATRAAAEYLAGAVKQTAGIVPEITTEKEDGKQYISIIAETEAEEENNNTEEAGSSPYSITLEKEGLFIRTSGGSQCYGTVRAIAERWLQEDCGLRKGDELRISRSMIANSLSLLPTEIPGKIKILSQNLCYSDDGPGKSVAERAKRFFQLVEEYEPDLIGIQEGGGAWNAPLLQGLSDRYAFFGFPQTGADPVEGSWDAILYRKDRFTLEDGAFFWLSNTPDEPYTKLNYMGAYRLCDWVLLNDSETGKTLLFSNTHLQNDGNANSTEIRLREAEILIWQLQRSNNLLEKYPGFLTGDFNGTSDEPFYSQITAYYEDSRNTAVTNSSAVDYSYHGYETAQWLIDYCFHSPGNTTVLDYHILNDTYDGFVSDHYGLLITAVVN